MSTPGSNTNLDGADRPTTPTSPRLETAGLPPTGLPPQPPLSASAAAPAAADPLAGTRQQTRLAALAAESARLAGPRGPSPGAGFPAPASASAPSASLASASPFAASPPPPTRAEAEQRELLVASRKSLGPQAPVSRDFIPAAATFSQQLADRRDAERHAAELRAATDETTTPAATEQPQAGAHPHADAVEQALARLVAIQEIQERVELAKAALARDERALNNARHQDHLRSGATTTYVPIYTASGPPQALVNPAPAQSEEERMMGSFSYPTLAALPALKLFRGTNPDTATQEVQEHFDLQDNMFHQLGPHMVYNPKWSAAANAAIWDRQLVVVKRGLGPEANQFLRTNTALRKEMGDPPIDSFAALAELFISKYSSTTDGELAFTQFMGLNGLSRAGQMLPGEGTQSWADRLIALRMRIPFGRVSQREFMALLDYLGNSHCKKAFDKIVARNTELRKTTKAEDMPVYSIAAYVQELETLLTQERIPHNPPHHGGGGGGAGRGGQRGGRGNNTKSLHQLTKDDIPALTAEDIEEILQQNKEYSKSIMELQADSNLDHADAETKAVAALALAKSTAATTAAATKKKFDDIKAKAAKAKAARLADKPEERLWYAKECVKWIRSKGFCARCGGKLNHGTKCKMVDMRTVAPLKEHLKIEPSWAELGKDPLFA